MFIFQICSFRVYEEERPADALEYAMNLVDEDNYGDDDTCGIESALAMERIMRENNVKPLDLDIADDLHGMLIREAKAEALRRYEEAER